MPHQKPQYSRAPKEEGEVFLIDKPLEWTSFDVVKKIRNRVPYKKVGHAGTLDPLASGLLIICAGKKTKTIDSLQGLEKEYEGTLVLGATTPSYDLETEITPQQDPSHLSAEDIRKATEPFMGEIMQAPPIFSAIKKGGKRAYESARAGKELKMEKRPVHIYEFSITEIAGPEVYFRVRCSKGTYIRSLAHDFGQALGVGAYLSALRRTAIGPYRIEKAQSIEEIIEEFSQHRV